MDHSEKRTGRGALTALLIICVCAFAVTAAFVVTGASDGTDEAVLAWAYGLRSGALTPVMLFITHLADWRIITAIIVVLVAVPKTRVRIGLPMAVTSTASLILYKGLKEIFARPRPDALMWLVQEHGYSFPSGHTMNGLICYAMLIVLARRMIKSRALANALTALLTALIILIGFSRLYLGVHYLTDVLAGAAAGLACVTAALIILDIIKEKTGRTGVREKLSV